MNNCQVADRAKIIVGSKAQFTLYLVDEKGRPISLSPFSAGNIVFLNNDGVRTVIALTLPGANPDAGALPITIPAVSTAFADAKWGSCDVELTQGSDLVIVPINDKFEIVTRNAPPIV